MVTILLATLNGEDYLKAQLESIAAQTYENWQLVVGDDGSTDGTLSIIEQWKQKDDRIIIINQENKGVSAARNQGLNLAKGEFIYFLDGDDKVADVAILKKCCEQMQRDNLEILIGAARSFYEFPELQNKFP